MTRARAIAQLAKDAAYAISDLMGDEGYHAFLALPKTEQVIWRYCHADCDYFALALHRALGWPVVSLTSGPDMPLHRLVKSPLHGLLDASGWVDEGTLRKHYGLKNARFSPPGGEDLITGGSPEEDEALIPALQAILHLPHPPFSEQWLKRKVRDFLKSIHQRGMTIPKSYTKINREEKENAMCTCKGNACCQKNGQQPTERKCGCKEAGPHGETHNNTCDCNKRCNHEKKE